MLPKVATSLTRAVTSIQHQSHTIRNVLHQSSPNTALAPWSSPASSNHRGTGSRYTGYTGAGRAVTQANATISPHDGSFVQADDQQDESKRPLPRTARIRSSSLSIAPRGGVLNTVQRHARSRHAFAAESRTSAEPLEPLEPIDLQPQPLEPQPLEPQPLEPQPLEPQPLPLDAQSSALLRLNQARDSGSSIRVAEAVRDFRQHVVNPSVREFNAAIEAIQATRRSGEPLNLMLDTYNDMLRHSLLPNFRTYVALIDSLTARDHEVHEAISSLRQRIQHRALTGFNHPAADEADRHRIALLRRENNFPSAMSLFETLISLPDPDRLSPSIYSSLIRSCAIHSNIDAAIHVYAQQEARTDILPSVYSYLEMIRVYTNADQLPGAEEIFAEYRNALTSGRVYFSWGTPGADPNRLNLLVWNQMIETYFRFDRADKAIALVEQMLDAQISDHNLVADPPPVSTATFTAVITGFCHIGDVDTAIVWFDRLLTQRAPSPDPYEPTGVAMKPDHVAWRVMLDALGVKGRIKDLNRLYTIRLQHHSPTRSIERTLVYAANMANLKSLDDDEFKRTLTWLQQHVIDPASGFKLKYRLILTDEISAAYLDRNMYDHAFATFSSYMADFIKAVTSGSTQGFGTAPSIGEVEDLQTKFITNLYQRSQGNIPYSIPLELARFATKVRITQPPHSVPFFLQSYALARASQTLPVAAMNIRDWELILMAADSFETVSNNPENPLPPDFAYQGLPSLIRDLATYHVSMDKMAMRIVRRIIFLLAQRLGSDGMVALLEETGFNHLLGNEPQQYVDALNAALDDSAASVTETIDSGYASDTPLKFDHYLTKLVIDTIRRSKDSYPDAINSAFTKFKESLESGRVPYANGFAWLIEGLGRCERTEDIHFAYSVAQRVLQMLENDKRAQTHGWFQVENAMVIACAHAGDIEGAHQYRRRVLANGGAPNADAYGALIKNVNDTTDDATNALELYKESQIYRVQPNQYLYNNIISKLAKARKVDYALSLFQEMKGSGIKPTSVSYGAIISACARVGDVHSAELLFSEMTLAKSFRARIPPYNTMMQMYTTIKPDRERALHYYQELRKTSLAPTAYTYKLLLDAYGSIHPIDHAGLQSTWDSLQADEKVPVQSIHYASLLNAYGCVSKDLNKAVQVFNDMEIARDFLIYEAMFNVFAVHRREDLIREYVTKMHLEGVRMTAYVANSLIRGYALLDKIGDARGVFESLEDPPEGVAAPNNSPLHMAAMVDPSTPVYREPSTWEAMVRAELGSGNRDGALDLLERLKARQYPEAVYSRISGILVEH